MLFSSSFLVQRGYSSPGAVCLIVLFLVALFTGASRPAHAQSSISIDRRQSTQSLSTKRKRGREMLKTIKADIESNYYDPKFHGVDLDAKFKEADEMIKNAESNGMIFGVIARLLLEFNDSHLYFLPPERNLRPDYGWEMQMIGDKCYVVGVKPGSDAEAKGVKPGDLVYFVSEMKPTRADLWKIQYLLNVLRPQEQLQVVLQTASEPPREIVLKTKFVDPWKVDKDKKDKNKDADEGDDSESEVENTLRLKSQRYVEMGDDLFIWKMPSFAVLPDEVDKVMKRVVGKKALVLDLRNNGGGYEVTMLRLINHFIEQEVKVGEMVRRKGKKTLVAKPLKDRTFKGKLVVLVDSRSGSAAELFARVMQLERRATILGDISSGAVMRAKTYAHEFIDGANVISVVPYEVVITDADLIMTDGKSLEHTGVTPDELTLPTGTDLASGRDPALARAVALAGVNLSAEKAGKLFPIEWRK